MLVQLRALAVAVDADHIAEAPGATGLNEPDEEQQATWRRGVVLEDDYCT
jgi:hypothetical protein